MVNSCRDIRANNVNRKKAESKKQGNAYFFPNFSIWWKLLIIFRPDLQKVEGKEKERIPLKQRKVEGGRERGEERGQ